MTLLWITLLLLQQGYSLVPVVTVKVGEPVTLTCDFTITFTSTTWLHWYKQKAGDTLKMISMQRKNIPPKYGPAFSNKTMSSSLTDKISNLTILRTAEEDEGIYHCALIDWTVATWNGTYLSIKGNTEKTSNYTVVSAHPAHSETLQCSVLSDSEDETCSEGLSVFWFRAGSENSYPDKIHTDGNKPGDCDKTSDSQRRCSYNFMNPSDTGTHYCAVATCGQIIFGNQIKLETNNKPDYTIALVVTIICFAISMVVNIIFICYQIQRSACKHLKETSSSNAKQNNLNQPKYYTEDGQDLNYAALRFSQGKAPNRKKKRELATEDCVYSHVITSV